MMRRVLAVLGCTALALVLAARAEPPAKPAAAKSEPKAADVTPAKIAGDQDAAAREYKQFEELLLRLALRMEKSPLPEDRKKAEALRAAINIANSQNVENRFSKLLATLLGKEGNARNLTTDELEKAAGQNEELIKILRDMLDILMTDSEVLRRREEMKQLSELIKQIDGLIRQEKVIQAAADGKRVDSKAVNKDQQKATQATESVHRAMGGKPNDPKDGKPTDPKDAKPKDPKDGKPADPKDGKPKDPKDPKDGKPGDPKDGKPGDPKDGKPGDPKDGKPKDGQPKDGKPMDGKPMDGQPMDGQPKDGSPSPGQPPKELPGKQQVQKAIQAQKQTEQNLEKDKREDASKKLDDVIDNLEQAKKELEKRLKQLREEEMLQLLANLQGRCERMLAIQREVLDGTKRVHATIQAYPDKKAQRGEEQRSQQLATRESDIVKEANKALQLLEAEGSAVVFAMAMEGVRDDAVSVEKRLDRYDPGETTQQTEQSIIDALVDMIEALKKAQQDIKDKQNKPPPPPNNNPPPPNKLLDLLAELKLIRTMQMQINTRTKQQASKFEGEQADDPLLQDEIANLAKRQAKIEEKLKNIATGKNQ